MGSPSRQLRWNRFVAGLSAARTGSCTGPEFESSEQTENAVEDRQRVGRTAGDVEIDRDIGRDAVEDFGAAPKRAAADGANADGNHQSRVRHRPVGLLE